METRALSFFAEAARGELLGVTGERRVERVVRDSRMVRSGDLYVALRGERTDGHAYVEEAWDRGAVAAVVARSELARWEGKPRLVVEDPRVALGRMAARYRAGFTVPVVAVAGSNGKTTTKELLGSVLGGCFPTLRSPESYNNDIGVPVTLLELELEHVAAVVEVGTNHPGELAPLLRMVQPRVGVLTHIGEEHLEHFGSVAGVLEEEGWLAEMLAPDGVLILPGDAWWTGAIRSRARSRVVTVGDSADCDWRMLEVEPDAEGSAFSVRAPQSEWSGEYRVNLLGRHQAMNALLALAAAAEFGLGREEIHRGLAGCRPARWRMNRWQWDGVEVIEDCYNANVDSAVAALEALRVFPCAGRRGAVLGDLAELGVHTRGAHERVGRRAAELGVDRLVAVGVWGGVTAAAGSGGRTEVVAVDTLGAAVVHLRHHLRPGDCLLIKGSRSARLERLGELLREADALERAA